MSTESIPVIPTMEEFEEILFELSVSAREEVLRLYNIEKEKGSLSKDGLMQDASSTGSAVMYLRANSKLYRFLSMIEYSPEHFYFISIYDKNVSIVLRNMGEGQSYSLKHAAYRVVVEGLRETYNWEIYNDVRVD